MRGHSPSIGEPAAPGRMHTLDGLRGWAALAVVVHHCVWETFGALHPGFRNLLTGVLNGELAVDVFFILSGAALSAPAFQTDPGAALRTLAARRYLRLTLPIAATSAVVFVLMAVGLTVNVSAAALLGREDWLGAWLRFAPTPEALVRYSLIGAYLDLDRGAAFDPFLWTMRIELQGSVLVFALLWLAGRSGWTLHRLALPSALLLLAWPPARHLAGFPIGMLLAQAWRDGALEARAPRRAAWTDAAVGAAALGLLILSSLAALRGAQGLQMLLAAPLAFAVFRQPTARHLLASPLSRRLGRLSFPLYLMQFPVLATLTSGLVLRFGAQEEATALAIAAVSVVACLGAAVLFEPVETLTRRLNARLVPSQPPRTRADLRPEPAAG